MVNSQIKELSDLHAIFGFGHAQLLEKKKKRNLKTETIEYILLLEKVTTHI